MKECNETNSADRHIQCAGSHANIYIQNIKPKTTSKNKQNERIKCDETNSAYRMCSLPIECVLFL